MKDKPVPPPVPQLELKGYRALIQLDHRDTGEIELPELSQAFDDKCGIVVLLGDGRVDFASFGPMETTRHLKWDVRIGDRVLLSEFAVTPFHSEGWEYRIVSGSDIVAVLPAVAEAGPIQEAA